jgi:hypothetical protein
MNSNILKGAVSALGIAVLGLAFNGQSAIAQSKDFSFKPIGVNTAQITPTNPGTYDNPNTTPQQPGTFETEPTPQQPGTFETEPAPAPGTTPTQQTTPIQPGVATRSGPSYIGIGGNIGITGDTEIGRGAFNVISKIGLARNLSFRPSAVINDNAVIQIPLTFDFPGEDVPGAELSLAPYLGGGLAVSTGQDSTVGGLITGGLDIPLGTQFTGNAAVNVGFIDETDVGVSLGVGYNF